MNYESIFKNEYSEDIENCINKYQETEDYEKSFNTLIELYKDEAYHYPGFINNIKMFEDQNRITKKENILLTAIFLFARKSNIDLEKSRRTIEIAFMSDKKLLFDLDEIKNSNLSETLKDYLQYCFGKLGDSY